MHAGGAVQTDTHYNNALYGPEGTPDNILDGKIGAPPEFDALYKVLQTIVDVSHGES